MQLQELLVVLEVINLLFHVDRGGLIVNVKRHFYVFSFQIFAVM